jgi:hypothetical protein
LHSSKCINTAFMWSTVERYFPYHPHLHLTLTNVVACAARSSRNLLRPDFCADRVHRDSPHAPLHQTASASRSTRQAVYLHFAILANMCCDIRPPFQAHASSARRAEQPTILQDLDVASTVPHAPQRLYEPRMYTRGLLDSIIGLECPGGLEQLLRPLFEHCKSTLSAEFSRNMPYTAGASGNFTVPHACIYGDTVHMTMPYTRCANWANSGFVHRCPEGQLSISNRWIQHVHFVVPWNIAQTFGFVWMSTNCLLGLTGCRRVS